MKECSSQLANAGIIILARMTFDVIFDILRYCYILTGSRDPYCTKKRTGNILTVIGIVYYPFIAIYSTLAINSMDSERCTG